MGRVSLFLEPLSCNHGPYPYHLADFLGLSESHKQIQCESFPATKLRQINYLLADVGIYVFRHMFPAFLLAILAVSVPIHSTHILSWLFKLLLEVWYLPSILLVLSGSFTRFSSFGNARLCLVWSTSMGCRVFRHFSSDRHWYWLCMFSDQIVFAKLTLSSVGYPIWESFTPFPPWSSKFCARVRWAVIQQSVSTHTASWPLSLSYMLHQGYSWVTDLLSVNVMAELTLRARHCVEWTTGIWRCRILSHII